MQFSQNLRRFLGLPRELAPADILAGLNRAMASKIITLVARVSYAPDCAVTGGGAKNKGLVKAIQEELSAHVFVKMSHR